MWRRDQGEGTIQNVCVVALEIISTVLTTLRLIKKQRVKIKWAIGGSILSWPLTFVGSGSPMWGVEKWKFENESRLTLKLQAHLEHVEGQRFWENSPKKGLNFICGWWFCLESAFGFGHKLNFLSRRQLVPQIWVLEQLHGHNFPNRWKKLFMGPKKGRTFWC